jgi:hypothetical protein
VSVSQESGAVKISLGQLDQRFHCFLPLMSEANFKATFLLFATSQSDPNQRDARMQRTICNFYFDQLTR